jgi:secondary thiamine-phosphate synthase enzyme
MMNVRHAELEIDTRGHGHTIDLSSEIDRWLVEIRARDGILGVFVPGSTAAVTTIEYEDGALRDLHEALEAIAPSDREYHHDRRWGDGNGFSHLRAALLGPSLTLPVADGGPIRGTWQQVVVVDCDNRTRRRRVVLSFVGDMKET